MLTPAQQRKYGLPQRQRVFVASSQPAFQQGQDICRQQIDLFEIGNDQSKDQSVDTPFEDIGNPLGAGCWRTDNHPAFNISRHFSVIALEERYTSRFGAVCVIRDGEIIETGFFDRTRISSGCLRMFGYALPEHRKIRHCRSGTDIAVGKTTCALEHRVGVSTHPNRNRTVSVRFWSQRNIVDLKKFSYEAHTLVLPKTAHELDRL